MCVRGRMEPTFLGGEWITKDKDGGLFDLGLCCKPGGGAIRCVITEGKERGVLLLLFCRLIGLRVDVVRMQRPARTRGSNEMIP